MANKKLIVDAGGAVFGRLCSFVSKKALEGNEIIVINSEKVIITGNKKDIIKKYKELKEKAGSSLKGPKFPRVAYRILKKGIKGMLPDFRRGFGKKTLLKIKCYDGVPKEFEGEKMIKSGKVKPKKYIELKELCEKL